MLATNIIDVDLEKNPPSSSIKSNNNMTIDNENPLEYFRKYFQYIWIFVFTLPLLLSIFFLLCYYITVKNGFVYPLFPYISDTGGHPPVACYFSMMIDIIALLVFIAGLFRYKQIEYYLSREKTATINAERQWLINLNYYSLIATWISPIGLIMIGNFRETENIHPHMAGFLVFWLPITYYMFAAIKIIDHIDCESSAITIRLQSWLSLISISIFIISMPISGYQRGNIMANLNNEIRQHWSPDDDGYEWHIFGAICEWIGIITSLSFISSIGLRMRRFEYWQQI
ncbi:DNA damage-regulated autophagy modulator protein [Dermatophagoides farinae]|uniref:DNA damage-regulated autophagy modulator protein n=1 Tax=Dermatophagoides farinae TaxID=6954 RepID=A0A922KSW5_DERFA|nr:DNA damage-regulated autophagy modulator protein [Dermatophagoides farinae]